MINALCPLNVLQSDHSWLHLQLAARCVLLCYISSAADNRAAVKFSVNIGLDNTVYGDHQKCEGHIKHPILWLTTMLKCL